MNITENEYWNEYMTLLREMKSVGGGYTPKGRWQDEPILFFSDYNKETSE